MLRNAVEGRTLSTAHKSQTVYHGPVAYLDDPYRRLESASSELELALLLVFLKETACRAQREYRFAVWAEDEPAEDTLDLGVSAALVDAMGKPRPEPEGSGFVPGGPVTLHNGSNTLWYALLVLVPARNSVLAFAANDGAIRRAENAFGELARELTAPTPPGSRRR